MTDERFVIWSIEHQLWWRADWRGYTATLDAAGIYSAAETRRILERANTIDVNECAIPATRLPLARCVIGEYCARHQFVHGAEAGELRQRLEALDDPRVRAILEDVDARDALAYVEARAVAADGNQQPRDSAVDPAAPRTVTGPTRDSSSSEER